MRGIRRHKIFKEKVMGSVGVKAEKGRGGWVVVQCRAQ